MKKWITLSGIIVALVISVIALVKPSTVNNVYPAITHSTDLQQAYVSRVVDGDTIEVLINEKTYKIRYIGIDTPETVDPNRPVGSFGKEASDKNKELVLGKTVQLEKDVSDVDKYGRLLRYVYIDNVMINAELVRLGYAKASTYPPNVKYAELFVKLEKEARESNVGLWK